MDAMREELAEEALRDVREERLVRKAESAACSRDDCRCMAAFFFRICEVQLSVTIMSRQQPGANAVALGQRCLKTSALIQQGRDILKNLTALSSKKLLFRFCCP